MPNRDSFINNIQQGYSFASPSIMLGAANFELEIIKETQISIPLKTLNRHGLISGATGSGKTKTLQILAEQMSKYGIPSLLMDIKGDLSGIAMPESTNTKIAERSAQVGIPFAPEGNHVEFLTISDEAGTRLRATVSEFGPALFSKILELNDTQSGLVSVIFKYCDDYRLPLLDLSDMKAVLQHITSDGKEQFAQEFGVVSTVSAGIILRKIIELEQQGAMKFFGEISFEVSDLVRQDENGNGIISIVRLTDIQDKPKLFSTYMLQMLAEIYSSFPEEGDLDKPKLAIFIDEAHLVFQEASKVLLSQIETIIKLIRSKGVGVYFITQNPTDIPDAVLSQLGLKVQHSLRAFTAKDRKNINLAAQNYPLTEYYDVAALITNLGIGEAIITALNEKGIPTPLVHVMLRAPQSRMDILTDAEISDICRYSLIAEKYNPTLNRTSAREILLGKLESAAKPPAGEQDTEPNTPQPDSRPTKPKDDWFGKVLKDPITRRIGNTVAREITRGILDVLGLGGRRRR